VLDTLTPAERLAFVLHDVFELPFDEIAPMVGRPPAATRQLASRARRRVKGAEVPPPDPDLARQRAVVDAFFAAAREGEVDTLVSLLDADVVLRIDAGARRAASMVVHGAAEVATQARRGLRSVLVRSDVDLLLALVNGAAGVVVTVGGQPMTVMGSSSLAARSSRSTRSPTRSASAGLQPLSSPSSSRPGQDLDSPLTGDPRVVAWT
jgi:RNA polymerase sigma-70 factor (ECF subfamily)